MTRYAKFLGLLTGLVVFWGYVAGQFHPLIDHEMRLSGTYGELRSHHFHTGIDLKSSNGSSGDPIYAPVEGFVSRVARRASGYGKAIYVDHPDGTTTVFAHLLTMRDDLEAYLTDQQYRQESYEVNLYPPRDSFRVTKGEVIGYMGNTGHSSGPHLHFEMRDTESEIPINPLLHGWDIEDGVPPEIRALKIDLLDPNHLAYSHIKRYPTMFKRGRYRFRGDTLNIGAWRIGFLAKAYDKMEGSHNSNGIYSMRLIVDGMFQFGFSMDSIPFDQLRYLDAHIDFPERVQNREYYNRLYRLPGNVLDIYDESGAAGIIPLYQDRPQKIEIFVADTEGNESELEFWVRRDADAMVEQPPAFWTHSWPYDNPQTVEVGLACFEFPDSVFYSDPRVSIFRDSTGVSTPWSDWYGLELHDVPVHVPYRLSIKADDVPQELRSKAFIVHEDASGRQSNCGGTWVGQTLTTHMREDGRFGVEIDSIAPVIEAVRFRKNGLNKGRISFKVSDNLGVTGAARKFRIRGEIDGEWVLFKHNSRRDRVYYDIDDHCPHGRHELVLKVWDDRDNMGVFRSEFER